MAKYNRINFVDEVLGGSPTYNISGTGAGQTITLDQTVSQAGTPISAVNLGTLEDGIEANDYSRRFTTTGSSVVTDHIAYTLSQTGTYTSYTDNEQVRFEADIDSFDEFTNNYIPTMTADNAPSPFVASASSFNPGDNPYEAFNKLTTSATSYCFIIGSSGWLKIDLGTAQTVSKYRIGGVSTGTSTDPKNWTFEGSNNNSTWDILDTVTNATGLNSVVEYTPDTTGSYRYYRLNYTATIGGGNCLISVMNIDTGGILTGTPTLSIDGLTAKNIKGVDKIEAGKKYNAVYDSSDDTIDVSVSTFDISTSNEVTPAGGISLTGSSVTISGLDINADGGYYEIIIEGLSASVTAELYMYINGDTTNTKYRATNYVQASSYAQTSLASAPRICSGVLTTSGRNFGNIELFCDAYRAVANGQMSGTAQAEADILGTLYYTDLATNITSLTFALSTGTFASGTVKIYKRS